MQGGCQRFKVSRVGPTQWEVAEKYMRRWPTIPQACVRMCVCVCFPSSHSQMALSHGEAP